MFSKAIPYYNTLMNTRQASIGILILVVVIVGWVTYGQLRPNVVGFSPADGAKGVIVDTPIELEFSRSMRPETVIENVELNPDLAGEFTWVDNTLVFTPDEPWPRGTHIDVHLTEGARSSLGVGLRDELRWSFTVGRIRLVYLWPVDGPSELYALDLISGEVEQLTDSLGVLEYDVSEDGIKIFYSATNPSGGSDLWILNRRTGESELLLACESVTCRNPQVSPDQSMVAYEREVSAGLGQATYSQVWLTSVGPAGTNQVVIANRETRLPVWSPDGWLSLYDAGLDSYVFMDLKGDGEVFFDNLIGEAGSWSPNGNLFVASEFFDVDLDILRGPSGEAENSEVEEENLQAVSVLSTHLISFNLETYQISDLTVSDDLEDIGAVFSPSGVVLAFARRQIDEEGWSPGRQLWLMRADGREVRMLTDDPTYKHTAFAWRPDGTQIAYVRFNQTLLTAPSELWVIDADGRNALRLVIGGYAPQWLP
ncbi:MAG: hypothetical protein FVQ83_01730 [Chloroflexi bacterium]|nr:hypothetical protein [Chloroflexota bacterium]